MEIPTLLAVMLNPLDLMRVVILLQLDLSAILSFGNAIIEKVLGNGLGVLFSIVILLFWIGLPFMLGLKKFQKKDF